MNENNRTSYHTFGAFSRLALAILLTALIFGLQPLSVAHAADQVVTNTNDGGAGSLRQAIASVGAGETITFNLTYPATITLTSGELIINKNLTITGPGADQLTISGNDASRVFNVSSGTVTISGLTIRDGSVSGDPAQGGGVFVGSNATLTLQQVTVTDNLARASDGSDGGDAWGGGIYSEGALIVADSTVSANTARGGEASEDWSQGGLGTGGGIYSEGTLTVTASTISGNTARGGDAPGSYSNGGLGAGGGARVGSSSEWANVTVSGNTAQEGGGDTPGAAVGGGVYANSSGHKFSFCTIAGNEAYLDGGGIYGGDLFSMPSIKNTIIADNTANHAGPDVYGYFLSHGYNLIENTSGGTIQGDTTGNITGVDPNLGALGDNGGPTQTQALIVGSPAVDAGSSTDVDGDAVSADQRGTTRPTDGDGDSTADHDMGAYELAGIQCGIQAAGEPAIYTFLGNVGLEVDDDGTNLDCLRVTDIPYNHPNATSGGSGLGTATGKYWIINGLQSDMSTAATGYLVNLTLPHNLGASHANAKVCKYPGTQGGYGWDCFRSGSDASTVWLDGISSLSDWAVGDQVGPTATTLRGFGTRSASGASAVVFLAALTTIVSGLVLVLRKQRS